MSDNILNTPRRHQQQSRQALRDVVQNVDQSPRRHHSPSRPETPSPQPGCIERARADCRSANRAARNSELLSSPRRRLLHRQDENNPAGSSTSRSSLKIDMQSPTVCLLNSLSLMLPLTSYLFRFSSSPSALARSPGTLTSVSGEANQQQRILHASTPQTSREIPYPQRLNREQEARFQAVQPRTAQRPLAPLLPRAQEMPTYRIKPVTDIQVPPSARSLAQLCRQAREREARMRNEEMRRLGTLLNASDSGSQTTQLSPLSPLLPTQQMPTNRIVQPVTGIQVPPSARSLAQRLRRARERETRMRNEAQTAQRPLSPRPTQEMPTIKPVTDIQVPPSARSLAQRLRRAREREARMRNAAQTAQRPLAPLLPRAQEMPTNRIVQPATVIEIPPSARSLAQSRRQAREREARMRNEEMRRLGTLLNASDSGSQTSQRPLAPLLPTQEMPTSENRIKPVTVIEIPPSARSVAQKRRRSREREARMRNEEMRRISNSFQTAQRPLSPLLPSTQEIPINQIQPVTVIQVPPSARSLAQKRLRAREREAKMRNDEKRRTFENASDSSPQILPNIQPPLPLTQPLQEDKEPNDSLCTSST